MEQPASFGNWLTEYRQSLHLQRSELAARIGCAAITLRKIEIDERRPSRQMAEQLAEGLGISPERRPLFIRVARGEESVTHLPPPVPNRENASKPEPRQYQTNLPHLTTSLTGRGREIEDILELLNRSEVRLVTLTGAPGIGKTRLAIEAAATLQNKFKDGIFLVSLTPLNDPSLVLSAIAQVLQLDVTGKQSFGERLGKHLQTRHVLLVLDNFEHLMPAAPRLTQLLEATQHLKLIVTSRVALELSGEHRLVVLPLAVPPALENRHLHLTVPQLQERYSAIDLFIQRARAVKPTLNLSEGAVNAIGEICRKVDGLPLAIEFVAARTAYFTPQELLVQLNNHTSLKTLGSRDGPGHHLSLWHALDWSYGLLSADDRRLLRRLSVFVGGCTLEAIEAICCTESAANSTANSNIIAGITTLLSSSLLQRQEDEEGNSRYEMLEIVAEYALTQLQASGEAEAVRQRHATYYLGLAQAAEKEWDKPGEGPWLQRLAPERANLRTVLRWAIDTKNIEALLKLNGALFSFWNFSGSLKEARKWLDTSLGMAKGLVESDPAMLAVEAKVLNGAGYVAASLSDNVSAYDYFERGLELYRRLNDTRGIAWSIRGKAFALMQSDRFEGAEKLLNESLQLCEASGDGWGRAWSFYALAFLKLTEGDLAGARLSLMAAFGPLRQQNIPFGIYRTLLALGFTVFEQGDVGEAEKFFREALKFEQKNNQPMIISGGLEGIAMVLARKGQLVLAARLWAAAEAMHETTGQHRLPVFQRIYEEALQATRARVEPQSWNLAWKEGATLSPSQALVEALEATSTAEITNG
jgi:predicted ATPase/DNA-binding XRE family transcriptional regulator/Flp pilus assembly protein TadD